jgi:hypothetical protein
MEVWDGEGAQTGYCDPIGMPLDPSVVPKKGQRRPVNHEGPSFQIGTTKNT